MVFAILCHHYLLIIPSKYTIGPYICSHIELGFWGFGNWDGGVLFIGTKGKLLADCYGANPRLLPLSLNEQICLLICDT